MFIQQFSFQMYVQFSKILLNFYIIQFYSKYRIRSAEITMLIHSVIIILTAAATGPIQLISGLLTTRPVCHYPFCNILSIHVFALRIELSNF